jgi:hypothetical protein
MKMKDESNNAVNKNDSNAKKTKIRHKTIAKQKLLKNNQKIYEKNEKTTQTKENKSLKA